MHWSWERGISCLRLELILSHLEIDILHASASTMKPKFVPHTSSHVSHVLGVLQVKLETPKSAPDGKEAQLGQQVKVVETQDVPNPLDGPCESLLAGTAGLGIQWEWGWVLKSDNSWGEIPPTRVPALTACLHWLQEISNNCLFCISLQSCYRHAPRFWIYKK